MKAKVFISILMMIASFFVMNAVITDAQEPLPRVWLSSQTQAVQSGQEFTVAINVANAVGVYGGSFKLVYDPQVLEVVPAGDNVVSAGDFFAAGPSFTMKNSVNAQDGTIEYALTLMQPADPVTGSGIIGTITFRALRDATANITPLEGRLLSPEFTQADGRRIAERVNEVDASVEGMSVTVGAAGAQTASEVSSGTVTSVTYEEPMVVLTRSDVVVLVAAAVFFFAGLGLFTMTIAMYAKLGAQTRRRSESYL